MSNWNDNLNGKRVLVVINYGSNTITLTGVMYFMALNYAKLAIELTDNNGKKHIINWDYIVMIMPIE